MSPWINFLEERAQHFRNNRLIWIVLLSMNSRHNCKVENGNTFYELDAPCVKHQNRWQLPFAWLRNDAGSGMVDDVDDGNLEDSCPAINHPVDKFHKLLHCSGRRAAPRGSHYFLVAHCPDRNLRRKQGYVSVALVRRREDIWLVQDLRPPDIWQVQDWRLLDIWQLQGWRPPDIWQLQGWRPPDIWQVQDWRSPDIWQV